MDSKIVTREIRRELWPVLRSAGFEHFTGRKAWRHGTSKIDVVDFRSVGFYHAGVLGSTPFSFPVHLGCFLKHIPQAYPEAVKALDGELFPEEYACHFRRSLKKSIVQPELKSATIWFIGNDGRYLSEAIADVRTHLENDVPAWFNRFGDLHEVLTMLLNDEEGDIGKGGTWGIGTKTSARRHYLIGYTALALGNITSAREYLQRVVDFVRVSMLPGSMRGELEQIRMTLESTRR